MHRVHPKSLQIPVSLIGANNNILDWSTFELLSWLTKNADKFELEADDIDNIDESPLTGAEFLEQSDEDLSQQWAISIHSARKILERAKALQNSMIFNSRRASDPTILTPTAIADMAAGTPLNTITEEKKYNERENEREHDHDDHDHNGNARKSSSPPLSNHAKNKLAIHRRRLSQENRVSFGGHSNTNSLSVPPQFTQPMLTKSYSTMTSFSNQQTKLKIKINNDTFMGRLSQPKWWMDCNFSHIPNKIQSKDNAVIDITGALENPCVGILSFTLTLDPRYMHKSQSNATNANKYSFSPWLLNNPGLGAYPQTVPNIPSWMIGPGGLPYIPPAVERLYELQQDFAHQVTENEKRDLIKAQTKERKKRRKEEKVRRKERRVRERKRKKELRKQQKRGQKRQRRKAEKQLKNATTDAPNAADSSATKSTDSNTNNANKTGASASAMKDSGRLLLTVTEETGTEDTDNKTEEDSEAGQSSTPSKTTTAGSSTKSPPSIQIGSNSNSNDDNESTMSDVSTSDDSDDGDDGDDGDESSSSSDESSDSDFDDDNQHKKKELGIEMEEAPKFRLIIIWSITPNTNARSKTDRSADLARNSMLSVASSDLLHSMNRFNVLLLEDDIDANNADDELQLDNTYFTELESAAKIADIEQCLVQNELFEISATFGTSTINNEYTFAIDIDDALGQWPSPLTTMNSGAAQNPFAMGFVPPMMNGMSGMNMAMMAQMQMQLQMAGQPKQHGRIQAHAHPQSRMNHLQQHQSHNKRSSRLSPSHPQSRSRSNTVPYPQPYEYSSDADGRGGGGRERMHTKASASKMFTLNDVVHLSRSPVNDYNGPKGFPSFPPLSSHKPPTPGLQRMVSPGYGKRRSQAMGSTAQRLSSWKEEMNYLKKNSERENFLGQRLKLHAIPSSSSVGGGRKSAEYAVVTPRSRPSMGTNNNNHDNNRDGNRIRFGNQSGGRNGNNNSNQSNQSNQNNDPSGPPPRQLTRSNTMGNILIEYNIGDCILVDGSKLGQIKSIGQQPQWGNGTFYGVRLIANAGVCDGSWKGVRCFSCPQGFGLFVQKLRITQKLPTAKFDFMNENFIADSKQNERSQQLVELSKLWRKYYAQNLMSPLNKKQFISLSRGPGVGLTTTEATAVFYEMDVNKSGSVNYAQMHALSHNQRPPPPPPQSEKRQNNSRTNPQSDDDDDGDDDEDPGVSDIPNSAADYSLLAHASSERVLSRSPKPGRVVPSWQKNKHKSKRPKASPPPPRKRRRNSVSKKTSSKDNNSITAKWTGGAPRTVVVRNKIPPIKKHIGYRTCLEGVKLQKQKQFHLAVDKFKVGISLLQVTLLEIDRSMEKRKWKAVIEEFRHKQSRCTFEIQSTKRSRFLAKRDDTIQKQANLKAEAEIDVQRKAMQEALSQAVGRERNWTVTREDMEAKRAEHQADIDAGHEHDHTHLSDSDDDDGGGGGRSGKKSGNSKYMRDKSIAKAKREHRQRKKGKGKKDFRDYPGYGGEMGSSAGESVDSDASDASSGSGSGSGGGGKKGKEKKSKQDTALESRLKSDIMTAAPDVSFADVVGLANVKLALYESIILPFLRPDLFATIKKSTQGLLLFGPPGNGKTMIAKCVAAQCDCTFFSISASSITSKFVGEAERIMRTLFDMARARSPAIIFIDEIDSLLRARGGANEAESSRRIKTEFLIQFDGVKTAAQNDTSVTIIGATNLPDQLDDAVLRRFPKRILVPNPGQDARYGLLRLLMSKQRHALTEANFQAIATKLDGYSCSDIAMLCTDASMGPLRSMGGAALLSARKSQIPFISVKHFSNSLKNVRASLSEAGVNAYRKWDDEFGSKLFLTMDVLPEDMHTKALLSVENEKLARKKKAEEEMQALLAKEQAIKQKKLAKQQKKLQRQQEREQREQGHSHSHSHSQQQSSETGSIAGNDTPNDNDNNNNSNRSKPNRTPKSTKRNSNSPPKTIDLSNYGSNHSNNAGKRNSGKKSSHQKQNSNSMKQTKKKKGRLSSLFKKKTKKAK